MEGLILLVERILHQFEVGSLSRYFWDFVYQVVQSDFFHELYPMGSHEGLWETMGFPWAFPMVSRIYNPVMSGIKRLQLDPHKPDLSLLGRGGTCNKWVSFVNDYH